MSKLGLIDPGFGELINPELPTQLEKSEHILAAGRLQAKIAVECNGDPVRMALDTYLCFGLAARMARYDLMFSRARFLESKQEPILEEPYNLVLVGLLEKLNGTAGGNNPDQQQSANFGPFYDGLPVVAKHSSHKRELSILAGIDSALAGRRNHKKDVSLFTGIDPMLAACTEQAQDYFLKGGEQPRDLKGFMVLISHTADMHFLSAVRPYIKEEEFVPVPPDKLKGELLKLFSYPPHWRPGGMSWLETDPPVGAPTYECRSWIEKQYEYLSG